MDSKLINFDTKDIHGRTPLMKTCIYGHNYVIKLLIIQEATKNIDFNGKDTCG